MKRITQASLDELAQRHGFKVFQDLCQNLESSTDPESLAIDLIRLNDQLKQLMSIDQARLPSRNGLADIEVDATGLPHLNDLVLTVSRLIVKLLLGYDSDEVQFLRDRAIDIEAKHAHEAYQRNRKASGFGGLSHA